MATTVTLDSEIVQAIQQATKQKSKASAVRMALNEYLRLQKLRQIPLCVDRTNQILATELDSAAIVQILARLGCWAEPAELTKGL